MKQITTGTVQSAQIEVTNLHDDTRQFDITAIVHHSAKDDAFGGNANGQISNGAVNIDGVTRATFTQTRNLSVNYLTDDTEQQQAILAAVQDFSTEAIAFAKNVTLTAVIAQKQEQEQ